MITPVSIFDQLASEHEQISIFIELFDKACWKVFQGEQVDSLFFEKAFLFIENYIGNYHHSKEEVLLFPEVHKRFSTQLAGSHCTYFYEDFYQKRFLKQFQEETSLRGLASYVSPPELKDIRDEKSPLTIPIEEHEAGFYALKLLESEWHFLQATPNRSPHTFARYGRWYTELLSSHVRKEDECLFVMLKEKLSKQQQASLAQTGLQMDIQMTERVAQSLVDLQFLKSFFS